jgi:hypothetical protein
VAASASSYGIYIYIYIYIYTHTHTHAFVCRLHTYIYIYIYIYTHKYIGIRNQGQQQRRDTQHTHRQSIYIHTHTHTYILTHTGIRNQGQQQRRNAQRTHRHPRRARTRMLTLMAHNPRTRDMPRATRRLPPPKLILPSHKFTHRESCVQPRDVVRSTPGGATYKYSAAHRIGTVQGVVRWSAYPTFGIRCNYRHIQHQREQHVCEKLGISAGCVCGCA